MTRKYTHAIGAAGSVALLSTALAFGTQQAAWAVVASVAIAALAYAILALVDGATDRRASPRWSRLRRRQRRRLRRRHRRRRD